MKILLVEDNRPLANIIQEVFRDLGHEIYWVDSISRAEERLKLETFDGIICDGTVDRNDRGDGLRFVEQLIRDGKNVVLFSTMSNTDVPEGIPFVQKSSRHSVKYLLEKLQTGRKDKS